ncbi:MAG: 50S ribosomal protein L17 [Candidatus Marinimicrobia bacterium]|nr:50S ribosomal protein L17 [Candidatus Neomarinimicrobiota bacterium]TFB11576.1 50S ribosomal protein L17 [Candidatus Marinimicrobia bacterium MT.SAG.2]
MRHRIKKNKLNRTTSHRKAMLNNMVASLFEHKQIKTTHAKAKEARKLAERLITFAKKGDLAARRHVLRFIPNKALVRELFDVIAPVYAERVGGYTRVLKLGYRQGDGADMSLLELVDIEKAVVEKKEKKEGIADKLRKVRSGGG